MLSGEYMLWPKMRGSCYILTTNFALISCHDILLCLKILEYKTEQHIFQCIYSKYSTYVNITACVYMLMAIHTKIVIEQIYDWPLLLFGDNRKLHTHTSCFHSEAADGSTQCLQNNVMTLKTCLGAFWISLYLITVYPHYQKCQLTPVESFIGKPGLDFSSYRL